MRFGVCAGTAEAEVVAEAGYDYVEMTVAGDLMPEKGEAEWAEKRKAIQAMPVPVEAFNIFLGGLKIVGDTVEPERVRQYVQTALARAAEVGGKLIVFGSGAARKIPDGFPKEQAARQLNDFLHLCADVSDQTGVLVVIEPLNRGETNVFNLVSQGAEIARKLGRKGVRTLADTYHMLLENEPLSVIIENADMMAHAHTADRNRLAPSTGDYDFEGLFRTFKAANYDQRLSIECDWRGQFNEQIAPSLQMLKTAYQRAASA